MSRNFARFAAAILTAASIAFSTAHCLAAPSLYPTDSKPNEVARADAIVLRDAKRNKNLSLMAVYPTATGRFPIIVFSHGGGGAPSSYSALTSFWASHGYLVIAPVHADSTAGQSDGGGRGAALGGLMRAMRETGSPDRVLDVAFVLDSLDALTRQLPQWKGTVDKSRIGVGGHSLGAYTAQLIGGATIEMPAAQPKALQSFADARVGAVLQLSGQGSGQQGLTKNSWQNLKIPMMTMTGSRDRGAQGQSPEWKKEPFDGSPPGNKYHVFIEGANHFSFSGRMTGAGGGFGGNGGFGRRRQGREGAFGGVLDGGIGQRNGAGGLGGSQESIFSYVKSATLAFWDSSLQNDDRATAYLQSDALASYSKGAVALYRK